MEKKNINYFRIAAICFAISGLMFTIMSMLESGTHYLSLGLPQITLGLALNLIAIRQEQKSANDDDEK